MAILRIVDLLLTPLVLFAGLTLKAIRRVGLHRLRFCRGILLRAGVLPIRRHYYEPFVDPRELRHPLGMERMLPGIDWNVARQLEVLNQMRHESELTDLTAPRTSELDFRLANGSFESGDAEYLYQMLRLRKPRRLYEIGSGNSTLVARRAIARNREGSPGYSCEHVCIEPYEMPWLESCGARILRKKVEEVGLAFFAELERGDLLFIDSSHVIRPQGDVLTEYLQILPSLKSGVMVHIHDIFSPRDYPADWLAERLLLWNEQYLLEAFLTENRAWSVIGALNFLSHRHFEALQRVCPYLTPDREPGSFYIEKCG